MSELTVEEQKIIEAVTSATKPIIQRVKGLDKHVDTLITRADVAAGDIKNVQEVMIEHIDRLLALEKVPTTPEPKHDKLYAALAKAQGEIKAAEAKSEAEVRKKETNAFLYSFKYADLAACLEVIRKPLSENGLALIQIPSIDGNVVSIRTIIGHESGQSISCVMTMTPDKSGPQAIGTCMSYLRRYSLCAMVGVAQFDDDAQSATADPDDYERLSPEQIDEILVLADKHFKRDADAKVNRMLDKAFQVTIVGDIPAKLFDSAINLLNNQAKREKAQTKKPAKTPRPESEPKDREPGEDDE